MFLGQSKNFSAKTILTTKSGLSGQFCGVPSKISLPVKRHKEAGTPRGVPASLCRFTSATQLGQAVNLIQVGNTGPAHQFICTDVSKRLHCPLHCLSCGGT